MKQLCGCCEGIEQVTPVSNVNRPGLSMLAYRVGTHATFLESMLARVSLHSFEFPESSASAGPQGDPKPEPRPLQALSTRESEDPAIAFLDAWATVADVLTFYQERIANEAYLRTAVERRSVLELARLIGYKLRPGVAASTYLAYTLDTGTEAVIPAGTRAQSVPGPGELPQPFETAEDLYAHGDWNLLQVRLTRPQLFDEKLVAEGKPIYLKGTATNLKEGDPILVIFVNPGATLYRVIKVEPDPAADRTKVIVQDWVSSPTPPPVPPPAPEPITLKDIITRHQDAEKIFGINVEARMAQRVLEQLLVLDSRLGELKDLVPTKVLPEAVKETLLLILTETLPPLREEHRLAREANFTKLEPWIGSLVAALDEVLEGISQRNLNKPAESAFAQVSSLLKALETPASVHPASRQQLGQNVKNLLSGPSDTLPKIFAKLRPNREMLYRALANLEVTPPQPVQVFALRARASVYGHNAPLKPITDPDSGRIERYEEWTLFRPRSINEHFLINIGSSQLPSPPAKPEITIDVKITGPRPVKGHNSFKDGNFNIELRGDNAADNEDVAANLSTTVDPPSVALSLQFPLRGMRILIQGSSVGGLTVTSSGSDPTSVTIRSVVGHAFAGGGDEKIVIEGEVQSIVDEEPTEHKDVVSLDAPYNQILPGSLAVLERPTSLAGETVLVRRIVRVNTVSRADYGITGTGAQLQLDQPWIAPVLDGDKFDVIRGTAVLAQSELLEIAEEPIDPVREAVFGSRIELANVVNGLEPGRWLVITGERADVARADEPRSLNLRSGQQGGGALSLEAEAGAAIEPDSAAKTIVSGVKASELVMLAGADQSYDPSLPGDKTHTTLLLAQSLAYLYKRDTIRIYGNVTRATNGETKNEILGSGNASRALQSFALRQPPLTYLSAPTPSGAESTLQVRINQVLWHEAESLAELTPRDRRYVTKTDDESKTTIIFGNGEKGARLPTGAENVTAVYRAGIGKVGNVKADQITLLVTKPLNVKEVINPLPATGGADREDRDEARRNAPLVTTSLDRLVSTRDYEDFARTFAGVAKASAKRLSDGLRQVVHLTIAGADDIPISVNSDLYRNLRAALSKFGDPFQPIQIANRFLKLLVVSANVRIHPDYIWEAVEPKIRTAMLDRFSFKERQLGQDVVLSEVIETIQSIEGVIYVDVDTFDDVPENITAEELVLVSSQLGLYPRIRAYLAQVDRTAIDPSVRIRPAQLVLLSPLVNETLILKELKG